MKVVCYYCERGPLAGEMGASTASSANRRARHIAQGFAEGMRRHGVEAVVSNRFDGVAGDLAVAYGWIHEPIFEAYRRAGGHYVYWDLGYWGRRPTISPVEGYHRMALDAWDTLTYMRQGMPADRWDALNIGVSVNQRRGSDVIVAGMSDKAAGTHGFAPGRWEEWAESYVRELVPDANVVMRAKPNKRARAVRPIEQALETAKLIVTHHSNVALDAIVAGVPVFCRKGIGRLASPEVLTADYIRDPVQPVYSVRRQILYDAAYQQWTPAEMRDGRAWDFIREML